MSKRRYAVCLSIYLLFKLVQAQDFHYTQFFNSPLTLNPALTGFTRGGYRIGTTYRNQWFGISSSSFFRSMYSTPSVFFDIPIGVGKDVVGIGGLFISDQTGSNILSSFTGCGSVAYIKTLGKKSNHQVTAGVQLGYTNKQINATGLTFSTQFIGANFIPTLSSGENFLSTNVSLFNLNTGVLWFGRINQRVSMYAGTSFFNVLQLSENFLQNSRSPWFLRWNVHSGIDISLGRLIHLLPSAMFMKQSSANQLLMGFSLAYDITPVATISFGSMVRVNDFFNKAIQADAVPIYGSFDYKGFKMGISYDFTVSKLQQNPSVLGAFEISLIYIGKRRNKNSIIFCPMF